MGIRVKTFLSPQYEEMYQKFFLPSLRKAEPNASFEKYEFDIGGNGQFGSPEFRIAQCIKWKKLFEWLYEDSSPLVFCDVDVLFIKPFLAQIESDSEGVDISLQEGYYPKWANVGVMFIRPTTVTRKFVGDVLEKSISQNLQWDEAIANKLLFEGKFPYKILSRRYGSDYHMDNDPLLYHAIPTYPKNPLPCLEQKVNLMSAVKNKLGLEL